MLLCFSEGRAISGRLPGRFLQAPSCRFSAWPGNETVEPNKSANAGSPKVRLSHGEVENENDDKSENDSRTYQIPMTFHQRPPITIQMRRLMAPVSAPNFHQVPSST